MAEAADLALARCRPLWQQVEETVLVNQAKVLNAFQKVGVAEYHFGGSTGYGYGDAGRDALEALYAETFGAEAALVRAQIASGTHALALTLFGCLRPGDELISAVGSPYDTLQSVIQTGEGSLAEWGIHYKEVALAADGRPDLAGLAAAIGPKTRVIWIQRSRGYSLRPSLTVAQVAEVIQAAKAVKPDLLCLVDNCYGEFAEILEPTEVGADLMAGSLIKNPGGGLAPSGGYVVGRADLVERAAVQLTAPGLGSELGAGPGGHRLLFQGFFLAPHVTGEALKGAIFTAAFFEALGFTVTPRADELRTDLIQAVNFGSAEGLITFCQAIQAAAPVDAHVQPVPAPMPGYEDPVIMAAGAFVQGSSIELSADGPLRPPYAAYFQGGLTKEHVLVAAVRAARRLAEAGLLPTKG